MRRQVAPSVTLANQTLPALVMSPPKQTQISQWASLPVHAAQQRIDMRAAQMRPFLSNHVSGTQLDHDTDRRRGVGQSGLVQCASSLPKPLYRYRSHLKDVRCGRLLQAIGRLRLYRDQPRGIRIPRVPSGEWHHHPQREPSPMVAGHHHTEADLRISAPTVGSKVRVATALSLEDADDRASVPVVIFSGTDPVIGWSRRSHPPSGPSPSRSPAPREVCEVTWRGRPKRTCPRC